MCLEKTNERREISCFVAVIFTLYIIHYILCIILFFLNINNISKTNIQDRLAELIFWIVMTSDDKKKIRFTCCIHVDFFVDFFSGICDLIKTVQMMAMFM